MVASYSRRLHHKSNPKSTVTNTLIIIIRVWTVERRITKQAMPLIPKEKHSTDLKILLFVSVSSALSDCYVIAMNVFPPRKLHNNRR